MEIDTKQLATISELSGLLDVDVEKVRYAIRRKKIPAVDRFGLVRVFSIPDQLETIRNAVIGIKPYPKHRGQS